MIVVSQLGEHGDEVIYEQLNTCRWVVTARGQMGGGRSSRARAVVTRLVVHGAVLIKGGLIGPVTLCGTAVRAIGRE